VNQALKPKLPLASHSEHEIEQLASVSVREKRNDGGLKPKLSFAGYKKNT
jgi:hypothetical protein